MSLEWHGDEILRKVQKASRNGIDETTAACALEAKTNHWWKNDTGTAEGSLQMRPSQTRGDITSGQWGSFNVAYVIYLELRQSFLRSAADREYPKLKSRISKYLSIGSIR